MANLVIPTFIINLPYRTDRRWHSIQQFHSRDEFDVQIIEAVEETSGAAGLWKTFQKIIGGLSEGKEDYILICEDDHLFTDEYNKEVLFDCIREAKKRGADVLLGGVSSVHSMFRVSTSLIWVEGFTGTQFTIIFKPIYNLILAAEFLEGDSADFKLASLSSHIFLIFPFISIQEEFGYSDVTPMNSQTGRVADLFVKATESVHYVLDSQKFYNYTPSRNEQFTRELVQGDFCIPVYVINLPNRPDRLVHIKSQFQGRQEFDVTVVEACVHDIGAVGLWESIRKVIQIGLENEDDVLIICEDDHLFTEDYSKEFLFGNIIAAHRQGVDVLSGGTSGGFGHALPVDEGRFWVNHFLATQFIVVYRKFFQKILDAPYDQDVTADNYLSELTCNKMVLYPFVSHQMDFGYSDVTPVHNQVTEIVGKMFARAEKRLNLIKSIFYEMSKKCS